MTDSTTAKSQFPDTRMGPVGEVHRIGPLKGLGGALDYWRRPGFRRVAAAAAVLPLLLGAVGVCPLAAQPYQDEPRTRHRFAQLLLGIDLQAFPSGGETSAATVPSGDLVRTTPGASMHPRLNFAGTHFWGHANFYVSVPLGNVLDENLPAGGEFSVNPGVETGARLYPWAVRDGAVRPFVGAAYAQADLRQRSVLGTGPEYQKSRIPLQAGLTYQRGSTLYELGFGRYLGNTLDYPVDRSRFTTVDLPRDYLWVGISRQLDTTLGLERGWRSGATEEATLRAAEAGGLSGWSLAAGPSAAFILGSSPRNQARYPALGDHRTVGLFADLGAGYYHYPLDLHLNVAYRGNASEREGYGQRQRIERRSVALEGFKFLFDYYGFAPFVGPVVSREWLRIEEWEDGASVYTGDDARWRAGIVFGWDIRPDDLRSVILRTNLRYTPLGRVGDLGGVAFDQLEFNFIQVVWYPGRSARIARAVGGGQERDSR